MGTAKPLWEVKKRFVVKKVFVKTSQNVSVSFVPNVSPTVHHHEQPAWLHLLGDLLVDIGKLL